MDNKHEIEFRNILNEIDSIDEASGRDINILREKTFNRELKDLVNRIKSNEDTSYDEIDDYSDDDLMVKLHQLFYKTKYIKETRSFNTGFNPFYMEHSGAKTGYEVFQHVTEVLQEFSLKPFALLTYNHEEKCYMQVMKNFTDNEDRYIIINPMDRLYTDIENSPHGISLSASDIDEDTFFQKMLPGFIKSRSGSSLYFILLNYISSGLQEEFQKILSEPCYDNFLSPILITEYDGSQYNEDEIFRIFKDYLSIPLFLAGENKKFIPDPAPVYGFSQLTNDIENILLSYFKADLYSVLLIDCMHTGIQSLLKMKFLYSKLLNSSEEYSIVLRISSHRIFIILKKTNLASLRSVIEEYNKIDEDIFSITELPIDNTDDFNEYLRKICI